MTRWRLGPGLLRIVLAAMVVCSHLLPLQIGRVAVAAFFTLSGYWVAVMYAHNYVRGPRPAVSFYVSRALRIYPTYYAVLGLTTLGLYAVGNAPHLVAGDITLLGLASAPSSVLWPAWSLDVELQFYLLAPLVFLVIGTHPGARAATLMVAAAAVLTAVAWATGLRETPFKFAAYALPFAFGVYGAVRQPRIGGALAAISLALFVAIAGIGLAVPALHWITLKAYTPPVNRDIVAIVWGAVLTPFILWVVRVPSSRLDRSLGDLAYTLYLCHWFFTTHFGQVFGFIPGKALRLAGGAATITATTLAVYVLIERPFEHFRRRVMRAVSGQAAARAPAATGLAAPAE